MQIITCPPYEAAIKLSLVRLRTGGTIVYPTDTIYGIGCDALNREAISKIMEIKKRDVQKPISVLFGSWKQACEYVKIDDLLIEKLDKITPGPYTFLLPLKKQIPATTDMVLGCRVPDDEFCKRICEQFENPIITTSANISGGKNPASISEIDELVLESVDLIVDGGITKYMDGSTIIDVEGKKILRRGAQANTAQKWLESL